TYVEVVYRLNNSGAVVTGMSYGTSHEGFQAEWRQVQLLTLDGNSMNRNELFDETDLDAALAKFDELSRPASRLENTASQTYKHFWTYFAERDWAAMGQALAEDYHGDDRRRVVNAGARNGRDAEIANLRVIADLGVDVQIQTLNVVATRGEHLVL